MGYFWDTNKQRATHKYSNTNFLKEQVLLPIRPKSRGSPILQLWKKLLESCFKSQLHQILLIQTQEYAVEMSKEKEYTPLENSTTRTAIMIRDTPTAEINCPSSRSLH